jgi:hypothetical protein
MIGTVHDQASGPPLPRRRRRCPRCGGPAIETLPSSPDAEPSAVCITCGHEFALAPRSSSGVAIPQGLTVALGFLAAGLLLGILLAALSSTINVGGWLLIIVGVGLVALMGALEAGYLDGLKPGTRRRPPPDI